MKNLWISLAALGLTSLTALAQEAKPASKPLSPPRGYRPQDRALPVAPARESLTIPATPEELAEGKKRLDALVGGHGGEAFLKLTSVSFTGSGSASLPGAGNLDFDSVSLTFAIPDRVRMDVNSVFGDISQVVPGAGKKSFLVMAGQIQDAPFDFRLPDPTAILREAVQRNLAVRPTPDLVEGKGSDKKTFKGISLPDEPGKPATTLYFDGEKGQVRRVVLKNKQGELTVNLSAYKTTEGVALPGTMAIYQGKDPLLTLNFTAAKVNQPLADDFFSPPKTGGR